MSAFMEMRQGSEDLNLLIKEKKTNNYHFHSKGEEEFSLTTLKETCMCVCCGVSLATAKQSMWTRNVERNFSVLATASKLTTHRAAHYRQQELVCWRQLCMSSSLSSHSQLIFQNTSKALFRAFLIKKNKGVFRLGAIQRSNDDKGTAVDEKTGTDTISTLSDVQLGQLQWLEGSLTGQLDWHLAEVQLV